MVWLKISFLTCVFGSDQIVLVSKSGLAETRTEIIMDIDTDMKMEKIAPNNKY